MTTPEQRPRPDGRAWREAQRLTAERNDEARKRGRQERSDGEKRDAARRVAAERGGVHW